MAYSRYKIISFHNHDLINTIDASCNAPFYLIEKPCQTHPNPPEKSGQAAAALFRALISQEIMALRVGLPITSHSK
jgi:hypothetical protein